MGLRVVLASLASPGIFMAKWVYGQSASKGRCVETSGTLEPVETSTGLHGETKLTEVVRHFGSSRGSID